MTNHAFYGRSIGTTEQVVACDYVGIVSGNKEPDKFLQKLDSMRPGPNMSMPLFDELPMALECELISYDKNSNHLVGRIVNITADESILTDGKIDPRKLRPISYDPIHHDYIELGSKVDDAFSCGKQLK